MTKKCKVLSTVSKEEQGLMYSVIITPKGQKPFGIEDWKSKEGLFNTVLNGAEKDENGNYQFQGAESITLPISEYEILLADLNSPVYNNLLFARMASELVDRLKNCETKEWVPESSEVKKAEIVS